MANYLIQARDTVWKRWQQNADAHPDRDAVVHWLAGEEPFRWTFGKLLRVATEMAERVKASGVQKGDVCAIILRHNKALYPLYVAISSIGGIPAILAYPNPRLHPDKFRQGLEGMSQRSGLDWIFTERALEPTIQPLVSGENSTIKGLFFPLESEDTPAAQCGSGQSQGGEQVLSTAGDPFLLQHSSGTTGLQKPVLLSHRAVLEHVHRYASAIQLRETDRIVSWLPLYHDMGLIAAFHLPLICGIATVQIDPFEWVMAPSILLEAVSREKGTISWLPNFALNMMADKIAEEELSGIDLRSWRMIINCSEPVRYESHCRCVERFRPYGLDPAALSSCYAMAETTFAVTQTPPQTTPTHMVVDRTELSRGRVLPCMDGKPARICVSSGTPITGCTVRIVDDNQREVEDGVVGEFAISSVSMFDGYRNYPEKTAEVVRDGWYYSGDYGFRSNGEYYIIGRKKDIIIVAGNNIYPEDVEDAVSKVGEVIPGRVVAFGEENADLGSEQVAVVAETEVTDDVRQRLLRLAIVKAGMAIDVTIGNVYLVPPRWLIKSSAGKPSRKANKERILADRASLEARTL